MSFCREILLIGHMLSAHSEPGFNNENWGAGLECRNARTSIAAGSYYNSFGRQAVYATGGVRAFQYRPINLRVDAVLGGASGYQGTGQPPLIAGALARVRFGNVEFGVFGFPPMGEGIVGLAHLTVSISFGKSVTID